MTEALNFRAAADGLFWMSWEDFIRTFSDLEVSHKTMRSGPGATRRAAWDRQKQADALSDKKGDKKGAGGGDKKGAVAGDSRAGREAARRMQRQRDRDGSRSTSPKGLGCTQSWMPSSLLPSPMRPRLGSRCRSRAHGDQTTIWMPPSLLPSRWPSQLDRCWGRAL